MYFRTYNCSLPFNSSNSSEVSVLDDATSFGLVRLLPNPKGETKKLPVFVEKTSVDPMKDGLPSQSKRGTTQDIFLARHARSPYRRARKYTQLFHTIVGLDAN